MATVQMLVAAVAGALAAFCLDFGAIRLINRLEGTRPETKNEERRSFTIGDKYFLPLAAGFEAIVIVQNLSLAGNHMSLLVAIMLLGLAYGLWQQWQNLRHDPDHAHKFAQWYHALVACTLLAVVVLLPIVALAFRVGPWWAIAGSLLCALGWLACGLSDIRAERIFLS